MAWCADAGGEGAVAGLQELRQHREGHPEPARGRTRERAASVGCCAPVPSRWPCQVGRSCSRPCLRTGMSAASASQRSADQSALLRMSSQGDSRGLVRAVEVMPAG